mgnify:FL=1
MQFDLSKKRVQQMAQTLRKEAAEGARPSYAQALDTVARMLGYQDFNALKPALEAPTPAPVRIIVDYSGGVIQWVETDAPIQFMRVDYDLFKDGTEFDDGPEAEPIAEQIDWYIPDWETLEPASTDKVEALAANIQDEFRAKVTDNARLVFGDEAVDQA